MPRLNNQKSIRKLCTLLVKAREEANLTQRQVASTGIISQSELSKIENGHRGVDFLVVLMLADLYKKDIAFFVPKPNK